MKVLLRPDLADEFIKEVFDRNNERPHEPEEFSAGITTLIGCIRKAWLRRHGYRSEMSPEGKLTVVRGTAYHKLLPPENEDREVGRRKKVSTGEITSYADWWSESGNTIEDQSVDLLIVNELKTTVMSANKEPTAYYVEQLAGNCWTAGANWGRLYIFYLVGTYRPPTPIVKVYEYYFSDDELERWGAELTRRLGVLRSDEMPSLDEHYKWECKYADGCEMLEKYGGVCEGGAGREYEWFGSDLEDLI